MRSGLPLAGGPDFFRAHRNSGALAVIGRDRVFRSSFSGRFAASQPPPPSGCIGPSRRFIPSPRTSDRFPQAAEPGRCTRKEVETMHPSARRTTEPAGGRTRAMHSKGNRDNASVRPQNDRTRRRQDPAMYPEREPRQCIRPPKGRPNPQAAGPGDALERKPSQCIRPPKGRPNPQAAEPSNGEEPAPQTADLPHRSRRSGIGADTRTRSAPTADSARSPPRKVPGRDRAMNFARHGK